MSKNTEQQSVRTTIVGGRPPGSGKPLGEVPRGIEILLKKSAVDPEFRELFLGDREEAARSIELDLDPMENAMLQAIPKEQLVAIIKTTEVPEPQRRVFLGKAVAAMLAVQAAGAVGGCLGSRPEDTQPAPAGIQPDMPPTPAGIQPDMLPAPAGGPPNMQPVSLGIRPDMLPAPVETQPDDGEETD